MVDRHTVPMDIVLGQKDTKATVDKISKKISNIPGVKEVYVDTDEYDKTWNRRKHNIERSIRDPKKKKNIEWVCKIVNDAVNATRLCTRDDYKTVDKAKDVLYEIKDRMDDEDTKSSINSAIVDLDHHGCYKTCYTTTLCNAYYDSRDNLVVELSGGIQANIPNRWGKYLDSIREVITIMNTNKNIADLWLKDVETNYDTFTVHFIVKLKNDINN